MTYMESVPGIRWSTWLALLILAACSDNQEKHQGSKVWDERNVQTTSKPPSSFSDTLTIAFPCAVFYSPDSLQLEKIKAVTNERVFQTMTHENFYLVKNARQVLQEFYADIKIVETNNNRYLLFRMRGGDKLLIDLNNSKYPFGLYIFDGIKAPILADMANIATDLGFYFEKTRGEKMPAK